MADPLVHAEPVSDSTPWRRFGPRSEALPEAFRATIDDPDLPYVLTLHLTFTTDRVECDRVECDRRPGGPPITPDAWARLRPADLIYRSALAAVRQQDTFTHPKTKKTTVAAYSAPTPGPRPARARMTPDLLADVATVYSVAYACGGQRQRAVMDTFGVPKTTAARWIRAARETYLLPVGED